MLTLDLSTLHVLLVPHPMEVAFKSSADHVLQGGPCDQALGTGGWLGRGGSSKMGWGSGKMVGWYHGPSHQSHPGGITGDVPSWPSDVIDEVMSQSTPVLVLIG